MTPVVSPDPIFDRAVQVLVVDDDPDDLEIARDLLEEMDGWTAEVTLASTYEEGLEALARGPFDVALVDYQLGAKTGLDFFAEASVRASGVPLVLLTGLGGRDLDVQATREGAADYLSKRDLSVPVLERSLRHAIERHRRAVVEARFRALIENSRDLIAIMRADQTVAYVSPSIRRVLGHDPAEVVGVDGLTFVHAEDYDRVRTALERVLDDPSSALALRLRARHAEGAWHVLDAVLENHLDNPLIAGLVVNAWDVTELSEAERELREQRGELQERIKELRALYGVHRVLHRSEDLVTTLAGVAESLPPGFQYPERMGARVRLGSIERRTPGYEPRGPVLASPVVVDGEVVGEIEVAFIELDPDEARNRFLAEEHDLVAAVADRMAESFARRRAERELQRREAYFRALADRSGLVFAVLDREAGVVHLSEGAHELLGAAPVPKGDSRRAEAGSVAELVHPDDRDTLLNAVRESVESPGEMRSGSVRSVPRGAEEASRVLEFTVRNLLDDADVAGIVVTLRDVTDRVTQEEQIRFQAELLDAVGQAVIATDLDGRVVYWNRAAEGLYGWGSDEVVGRGIETLLPAAGMDDLATEIKGLLQAGDSWSGEFQVRHRDGTAFPVFVTNSPILDTEGTPVGLVGVSSDLRERRDLEERLRQAQKMEAIGRLAGGVAHDFNNLLTAVQGHAEFLLSQLPEGSEMHEDALEIHRAGKRAADLTRQLLTFSRKQVLQEQVLDFGRVLGEMVPMLRRLLPANIDIKTHIDARPAWVRGDPSQMQQVILNLALNAGDAMEGDPGRLEMRVERTGAGDEAHVSLSVRDTGIGMDSATISRIFEPFFTTKPEGRGTGLGLATVFGIVEQSGGRIEVESEPGHGSLFRVLLPLAETGQEEPAPQSGATSGAPDRATLLVVEDDAAVRGLLRRVLDRLGYEVLEATNGHEALDVVRERGDAIHLVLSDVVMPGLGGADLADRLKELRPDVAVVLISGYSEEALAGGLEGRGDAFLPKPFTAQQLAEVVRRCLEG